ncbi:TIGR03756 family integrating conjugative element protein [Acidovorax sp. SUPP2539]|uniref:TIGR03756 family integrating conjugative element protein n=1 Tax=Acidovorax sp. SUPP2539 TaxID=2920878 RepID=UPI0023DE4E10|nr:TIGR03756 family integrating conjugative element protein [Acidovorax sp. SUPP2539]GKS92257.1 TIGR03756 family integrating conjugative element protein [Acidovorax sp. SUPP2539]
MRSKRLRAATFGVLFAATVPSYALDTATIVASAFSPDCFAYRVSGICYWLYCTWSGCTVRTSVKVRHYVPDAVVSSYSNTGVNPWVEVRAMSVPNPSAQAGGDGTTNQSHENNLAKFKNSDVIGHPAGEAFSAFASASGYTCEGAGTPFMPYLLSTFDTLAWRYNVPELAYPESLTPGMREIGSRLSADLWGNIYPRGGFLHQTDDHFSGAVVAQRAGDVVTRTGQPHVYQPLLASPRAGYWPAGPLVESNADSGKWQELTPTLSGQCAVFPNRGPHLQARQGDYAWALWRPYSCCQRRGQVFIGSTDF